VHQGKRAIEEGMYYRTLNTLWPFVFIDNPSSRVKGSLIFVYDSYWVFSIYSFYIHLSKLPLSESVFSKCNSTVLLAIRRLVIGGTCKAKYIQTRFLYSGFLQQKLKDSKCSAMLDPVHSVTVSQFIPFETHK
jgi:hypothetical protein